METKAKLLKEAGFKIRRNADGFYDAKLYAHSGGSKVWQSVGTFERREAAVRTCVNQAIERGSFSAAEWASAK